MESLLNANIVAPATVPGSGAVGIIRVSGADAITIASVIFKPAKGNRSTKATLKNTDSYKLTFGRITEGEKLIDEVLAAIFRAPNSYTGENAVEIYCHASSFIMNKIQMLLLNVASELYRKKTISAPLRMAEPGEFTKRAFLNGKMDLAQAEAVADLIASETEASHNIAMNQMRGGFSKELRAMRESLLNLCALIELELDFSEEDVEFADRKHLTALLENILKKINELSSSFAEGNAIKNGIPVAIVGAVNTGKSTLLNLLVGEERAIVSPIQGTTRDTIEDN
ncbi:MAG: 50S ribosome-binding GTPase, partial [Bacteroidales bacterium]|nr:50S ribosome-binding GTPase [Bacteroidales bacterium]